jgi:pimeloyl-ACP methyl ester carboxylesterase
MVTAGRRSRCWAEKGTAALAIDLCGHGENMAPIGPGMRDEVEAAVAFLRRFGKTAAVGHSLGGRLALMSSADVMVAMSPSVMVQMSPQGKWMFENLPSPGVREPHTGYVLELLEKLGPVPSHGRPATSRLFWMAPPACRRTSPGPRSASSPWTSAPMFSTNMA